LLTLKAITLSATWEGALEGSGDRLMISKAWHHIKERPGELSEGGFVKGGAPHEPVECLIER
jgi:hypothetical protein